MNGEVCCILQVCCPPEERAAALAKEMIKDGVFDQYHEPQELSAHAKRVADYIFKHFDLAPAGTLGQLVKSISRHAAEVERRKK